MNKLLNCKTFIELAQTCENSGFKFWGIDEYINALTDDIANSKKDIDMSQLVKEWEQEYQNVLAQREKGNKWMIGNIRHSVFLKGDDFQELLLSIKFHQDELSQLFGKTPEPDYYKVHCTKGKITNSFDIHSIFDINDILESSNNELHEINSFRQLLDEIIEAYECDNEVEVVYLLKSRIDEVEKKLEEKNVNYVICDMDSFETPLTFIKSNNIKEIFEEINAYSKKFKFDSISFEPMMNEPIMQQTEDNNYVPSF